jgi:hypothetical protein
MSEILKDYVTESELAEQLKMTPRTLQRWRRARKGPPATKAGRRPLHSIESVRAWLARGELAMACEHENA